MTDTITARGLRFERLLDAPVETVWQWIVKPELRVRWFMSGPGDDLRKGGQLGLAFSHEHLSDEDVPTPEKYRRYVGNEWRETITRFEPPHVLAFEWEGGAAGEVTITLTEAGRHTRLELVHTGIRGSDDAVNFGTGWGAHLEMLERRLRGETVADFWMLHGEAEQTAKMAVFDHTRGVTPERA